MSKPWLPFKRGSTASSQYNVYEDVVDEDRLISAMANKRMMARRKSVSAEGYNPDEDNEDDAKVVYPKSKEQKEHLAKVISNIVLFSSLDKDQTRSVIDAMFNREVKAGERVIEEGADGDNFYVIEKGDFQVFVKDATTGKPVQKFIYKGKGSFGELALLYNCPRSATVVAATRGSLWGLDRITFRRIVVKNAAKKRKKYEKFLKTVPLLSTLTDDERSRVADALGTVTFQKGHKVLEEGGKADYFYIVIEGSVLIKKNTNSLFSGKSESLLARCGPGDYFGELALITNKPRAASAIVDSNSCTCANVEAFERLLGPCRKLLMRNIPLYEEQLSKVESKFSIKKFFK